MFTSATMELNVLHTCRTITFDPAKLLGWVQSHCTTRCRNAHFVSAADWTGCRPHVKIEPRPGPRKRVTCFHLVFHPVGVLPAPGQAKEQDQKSELLNPLNCSPILFNQHPLHHSWLTTPILPELPPFRSVSRFPFFTRPYPTPGLAPLKFCLSAAGYYPLHLPHPPQGFQQTITATTT